MYSPNSCYGGVIDNDVNFSKLLINKLVQLSNTFFPGYISRDKIRPLKITVLGVKVQPDKEILREFVEKKGYSFPVLLDIAGKVFNEYQLKSVPTTIAINGRGEITYIQQGPMNEDNLKNIREILLEQWELRPIIV